MEFFFSNAFLLVFFPIEGDKSETTDLQSTPFKNLGRVPWAWHTNIQMDEQTEILVSNVGFTKHYKAVTYIIS